MNLGRIAEMVGGTIKGDENLEITGVGGIEDAVEGQITFLASKKFRAQAQKSKASAILVEREMETRMAQILSPNPALAFAKLLNHFHPPRRPEPKIDDRAAVGKNVQIGRNVTLSEFVSIGDDVMVGDETVLHPGVAVGDGCRIGNHSTLFPHVTLYPETVIGNHVILHAGAVIGADGFGYTPDERGRHFKINQVGRVVIEDHVEVGANTCIDRANLTVTLIKEGTKIDNLVQIAHNCTIGEHTIIVSQAGMSGSCTLGHHVVLAGQVGLADHVTIGDQAIMAARSATFRDIEPRTTHGGSPAAPLSTWKKYVTVLPKLPDLARKVKELEEKINRIENEKPAG